MRALPLFCAVCACFLVTYSAAQVKAVWSRQQGVATDKPFQTMVERRQVGGVYMATSYSPNLGETYSELRGIDRIGASVFHLTLPGERILDIGVADPNWFTVSDFFTLSLVGQQLEVKQRGMMGQVLQTYRMQTSFTVDKAEIKYLDDHRAMVFAYDANKEHAQIFDINLMNKTVAFSSEDLGSFLSYDWSNDLVIAQQVDDTLRFTTYGMHLNSRIYQDTETGYNLYGFAGTPNKIYAVMAKDSTPNNLRVVSFPYQTSNGTSEPWNVPISIEKFHKVTQNEEFLYYGSRNGLRSLQRVKLYTHLANSELFDGELTDTLKSVQINDRYRSYWTVSDDSEGAIVRRLESFGKDVRLPKGFRSHGLIVDKYNDLYVVGSQSVGSRLAPAISRVVESPHMEGNLFEMFGWQNMPSVYPNRPSTMFNGQYGVVTQTTQSLGSVQIMANGDIHYTPKLDFNGYEEIGFQLDRFGMKVHGTLRYYSVPFVKDIKYAKGVASGRRMRVALTFSGPMGYFKNFQVRYSPNLAGPEWLRLTEGDRTAVFYIEGLPVSGPQAGRFEVDNKTYQVAVRPGRLSGFSTSPQVVGGQPLQARVSLDGVRVNETPFTVTSSAPTVAPLPYPFTGQIPAGQDEYPFSLQTGAVSVPTTITLTASALGATRASTSLVTP